MFNANFMLRLSAVFMAGFFLLLALTGSDSEAATIEVSNAKFESMVTKDAPRTYKLNDGAADTVLKSFKIPNERNLLIEIHEIANNYIVADKIQGKREMTQERLNTLILILLAVENPEDYPHKAYLLDILTRWKSGEFFKLAHDHNYVWKALDGQVGRALGVKNDLPAWAIR